MLGIFWCGAIAWPPYHCVFKTCISCHFDLGSDWPVIPLMQVDKDVTQQFLFALPYNLHKPLSTCGMVSQHLVGAWLGFKFCWSQCIPTECHKPIGFEHVLFPMLETHYEQVQVFALSSWNMWGTHHQSTLAITMNCVKHGASLIVLALGLAHTMTKTTAAFWNVDSCSCTSSGFCGHPLNAQLVGTSWD